MSFSNNSSRFAFLVDDAPDPFETVKKRGNKTKSQAEKTKKSSQGQANGKKKTGKADNAKALQSMAFGGGSEGKAKKVAAVKRETSTEDVNRSNGHPSDSGDAHTTLGKQRPEGVTEAQWQEWQKRDYDYVSGTYESDLETALMQSKIDYQEQSRVKAEAQKAKTKKKPVPVSLTDFNAKLSEGNSILSHQNSNVNGSLSLNNGFSGPHETSDEALERFREEAQREIEREKQITLQRQLLLSRNQFVPQQAPQLSSGELELKQVILDKDKMIQQLSTEKIAILTEFETLKSRFKKLCSVLSDAQLKEKALLVSEVEKLGKLNSDLNEEVNTLHSQLEQEKSKAHAALTEYRKLVELQTRRRNNTEASQ